MNEEVTQQEIWQVDSGGTIFETTLDEMTQWIAEGSLLRIDRVRKGNLRWIEAGKVPVLIEFFNARESGAADPPPIVTVTSGNAPINTGSHEATVEAAQVCCIHEDLEAVFACETCFNHFCRTCPNSYGGTVKICPYCGAMCRPIQIRQETPEFAAPGASTRLSFSDVVESFGYPFKFLASLVLGAVMFMFLSVGQTVAGVGGIFMMWGALVCFLLANTLTFGILANTIDNFTQGKFGLNFMPSFDDFSLWDDVVHPFFLMIGAYISSFGPLIAVVLAAVFLIVLPATREIGKAQAEVIQAGNRPMPIELNAARQSREVRDLVEREKARQFESTTLESPTLTDPSEFESTTPGEPFSDEDIAEIQGLIDEHRKGQLESVVGKEPETLQNERFELFKELLGKGLILLAIAGICLIWGLFYFPAACAVAAYTRSFWAAVNPTVGLDTIKRLGIDYVKILLVGAFLLVLSGMVSGVLGVIFFPFDMPGLGNIPATAVGSLFGFYFSIVFSCVLGFVLYRAADKLELYR